MLRYIYIDDTGRIGASTDIAEYAGGMVPFEFPNDFDFSSQKNYRIVNGELTYDPKPISESEIEEENKKKYEEQIKLATVMMTRMNASSISDEKALEISSLFEEWAANVKYAKGNIVRYKDDIYRIGQDHTSQAQWVPGENGTESLYSHIHIDEGGYEVWKPWDGISGIYRQGQIVKDPNDGKLYVSKISNNVWGPPHEQLTYWGLYSK